ncbi:MAG: CvpA family protein [Planctomycetaceae bacterium]|nr:CvpA family protein [Planctomycetaceae bacterium]
MWYDAFVVAVLIVCTVRGAMRGVIWQLAGIAGLVLCLVFAETISATVGPHITLAEPLNHWVTLFGAYLGFSFLSFGVARMIHGWIEKSQMTEFNRHLGAVFGLIKGIAICLVLTFFIVTLSPSTRTMLQHSRSGYAAAVIMDRLHPVMPEKLHDALEEYIHQLDTPEMPLKHHHDHQHADGSQADDFPPGSNWETVTFPNTGTHWGGSATEPQSLNPIDEIVQRVPGVNQTQARYLVEQAYQLTPPALKTELIGELKAAAPGTILAVASKWLDQATRPAANGSSTRPADDRDGLIADIAARTSGLPAQQERLKSQIGEQLRGLPDGITLAVLRDWRADLTGAGQDPDPQTNRDTSVDQRIIRQLTLQRVSVYQLGQELQDRLRAAAQR